LLSSFLRVGEREHPLSEGCSEFVAHAVRSLERRESLPKSLVAELLETCGESFADELYRRPKLAFPLGVPLSDLLRERGVSGLLLSRAASLLELAARAGYNPPLDVVSKLMRAQAMRNRALSLALLTFARDPLRVAESELMGDKELRALLRSLALSRGFEEAFKEALSRRLGFPTLLASSKLMDEREVVASLLSKLLSKGREASLALRLLLALGVHGRVSAETPAALVFSAAHGEVRTVPPDVLEKSLVEAMTSALFLDRALPPERAAEPVKLLARALTRIASRGDPRLAADVLVSRFRLFLAAAEVWSRYGVLEALVSDLSKALGAFSAVLYAAAAQYLRDERHARVAQELVELLFPVSGQPRRSLPRAIAAFLESQRRGVGERPLARLDGYKVYVDVSNVIGKRGRLDLDDVKVFITELSRRGVEEVVLCYDSNLPWKLYGYLSRDKRRLYAAFRQHLEKIVEHSRKLGVKTVIMDPAPGQRADDLIVESVERCLERSERCLILSNDRFAEHAKKRSWLRDEKNFIRFRYSGESFVLYWNGRRI